MLKLQSSLKAACMAVAALAVSGCSQDELVNQPTQKGNTTIVASFEGAGPGTRTSVKQEGDAFNVVWNKDDAFGLFYTSNSQSTPQAAKFSCPNADGTSTSATFTGVMDDGVTTSYAVYPYNKDGMSLSGTTVTMKLPATLDYTEASNGPMYAPASDISQSLQFKHLAGLLKLTVSKGIDANAKKFVIKANTSIAGTCTADLSTDKPTLAVTADGSTTITVALPEFTDDGQGNVTTFYIPIPVGTYTTLSAQLTDDGGNDLYTPKEWTNVTVARAGMLTASFGYVKIDAGTGDLNQKIANALPTQTPPTAPMTTNLQIDGTINATSGTSAIEIPIVQNSNVNMELTTIPTTSAEKPLEVKDNDTDVTTPTDAKNTVTIAIPKVEQGTAAPHLTITMPQTTVELDATGEAGTTYEKVIATTAKNTLVIKKGVTVNTLVVKGGNVRVAGTVTNISKDEGLATTPYLIMENGATVSAGSDAFTVIDAAAYDLMMAVENGGTCTLSSDIALTEPIVVTKTTTLDLNGYSIKSKNNGDLKKVLSTSDALILVRREASLTIDDSSTGKTGSIDGSSVASIYAAVKLTDIADGATGANATLIVNGGTLKGYTTGISGNGLRHGTSITINGGIIGANDNGATGIYHPQDGTLTVNGGTITGPKTGIEIRSGKLEITNGIIKHTATQFEEASNDNGQTMAGAAVAVSQHVTDKELSVTISGGELQGGTLYALYEKDLQNDQVGNITMKVTAGKLAGQVFSENCKDFIEGCNFNDFSAMNYLANNKDVTVTLDSDVSIIGKSVLVPAGKKATLDLNGHTITADNSSDRSGGITVKGDFTLKDSKGSGKIVADHDWVKDEYGTTLIYIDGEDAHMTMESGTVYAVRSDDPANKGQYGVGVYDGGDFTMTGGKIEAGWFAVSGNGNNNTQNSIIKIEGGELISTADYAIYLPHTGTTTISGGKINGATGGIAIQRGALNISGDAEILSTDEGNTGNWTDGTGSLGNAALVVAAKYDDCTVNITGGTFSSLKNAALIDKGTITAHAKVINVSGGTFSDTGVLDYLTDNATVKVLLNADKSVKGFKTKEGQTVEIDLNTHTLTLTDPTVGSTGTETNSCQLLKGSKVTFKNGKVQSENEKLMIQNYCDLLLQDVTVEATKASYVISNNNGSCTINNSTITAGSGKCAFDVYSFSTYTGVTVTVNDGSTINGNVEFGGNNGKQNGKLIINGGTINGNLTVQEGYYSAENPNIVINGGNFGSYTGWEAYRQQQ